MEFRQGICAELASSPPLVERFEALYVRLQQFRVRISRPSVGIQDGIDRRLGILGAVRAVIESLSQDFAGTTSGLTRLHQFGQAMASTLGYRRLCELLDYEHKRAELDLRVGIGFDGRIRSFQTIERREKRSNSFYATPLGRLWTALSLLVGGYRAGTGELLSRLIDGVFSELESEVLFFFQLIGDLEVYLGALGFRRMAAEAGLAVCLPELSDRGPRSLSAPVQSLARGREAPLRSLRTSSSASTSTWCSSPGPNSGGKTRLLAGALLVPAARAKRPVRAGRARRAALGERALRVPASNTPRWIRPKAASAPSSCAFAASSSGCGVGSMVVMDELCSGTNPSEGEALMQLVLEALYQLGPQAFITTHFLEFAAQLAATSRQHRFLQAELDEHEQPTYAFTEGVARTSLAHRVAERLGVTRESLRALMARNNPGLRW